MMPNVILSTPITTAESYASGMILFFCDLRFGTDGPSQSDFTDGVERLSVHYHTPALRIVKKMPRNRSIAINILNETFRQPSSNSRLRCFTKGLPDWL